MEGPCRLVLGPLCTHLRLLSASSPWEVVGYIIGRRGEGEVHAYALYPAGNLDESPHSFTADPLDTIAAHKAAWSLGLDIVAIYHSHPRCGPEPSPRDLEGMKRWPIPWVIVGGAGDIAAWILASRTPQACRVECTALE